MCRARMVARTRLSSFGPDAGISGGGFGYRCNNQAAATRKPITRQIPSGAFLLKGRVIPRCSKPEAHSKIEQHTLRRRLEHHRRSRRPNNHSLHRTQAATAAVVPSAIINHLLGLERL